MAAFVVVFAALSFILNNKNNKETLSMARNEFFFFKILEERRHIADVKSTKDEVLGSSAWSCLGLRGAGLGSKFN